MTAESVPARTRGSLDRGRVLGAAVTLADAEGLAAVTMRSLAAALDVEAMSLYHHVPSKAALLDGLIEAVLTEVDEALAQRAGASPDEWRGAVRERCLVAREVMLRHPWAPGLIGTRTTVPVQAIMHYEAILAALIGGGFSYHLAHRALHALGSMVLGFVAEPFRPSSEGQGEPSPEEAATLAASMPHLAAMVAAEMHAADEPTLGWCDSQTEFEFTLDLLLDGLARHHAADVTA